MGPMIPAKSKKHPENELHENRPELKWVYLLKGCWQKNAPRQDVISSTYLGHQVT